MHKAIGSRDGFMATILAPVGSPIGLKFGFLDGVMTVALVLGAVAVMRLLLAN